MNFDYNVEKQEITIELNTPSITLDTPTGGRGLQGIQGPRGETGDTGPRGEDGYTPVKGVDYFTEEDIESLNIPTKVSDLSNDLNFIDNTIDNLTNYYTSTNTYTKTEIDTLVGNKQDTLVSGTNIKTINNTSLLGSGNINIQGGGGGSSTDVKINGTSITSNDVADIKTNGTYNATSNKIATMSDLPTVPTKVSDLTNDTGFITNTVNNLTNYYTSSNTYTKTEVDQLIGAISTLDIQIVQTLPATGSTSTIYLVPKTASTNDNYDEYIYVSNSWEHIGSTEVDLSNYYTKTETDGKYALKSLYGDTTINVGRKANTTVGTYSTAEGYDTTASGDYSTAEGYKTTASGDYSHAEGLQTTSSGDYSHTEGRATTAGGEDAHAEGYLTSASGSNSHAEGDFTFAKGYASHAEGKNTTAGSYYQHVSGKYNIEDTSDTYAEIIGNGTANNARSNARTLDWSGNEVLAGKLTVGTAPTNNMDVATKQYVDNAISGIPAADVYYVPSSDSSSSNPFILENHNPGVYIFEDSSNVYIKVLSTSSTSRLSNSPWAGTGFFLLATPTSEMTDGHIIAQYMSFGSKYPYKNTITFDSNVSDNYDYSSSSQYGLEWVNLSSAQTISGLKTFSTLPQSSVVPSDNKDLANKKYVDDAVSGSSVTDVQINGTSITSSGEANILTEGTYNASTNKIATMSDLSSKQDVLVSGTSIKTINSSSILGSGNLALSTATNLENGTGTGSLKSVGASLAAGDYSFAEGLYTTANSSYSHVEGNGTTTNGSYSHAEGLGSWTAQSGGAAHAEGYYTTARGYSSHSEGYYTEATSMAQHVQGKFNIVDSSGVYADIVGNGTDENTRSNAYTLDWSGNGVYAGKLTVGTGPTNNMDVATKQYVDNSVPSNDDIVDLIYPVGSLYMSTNATSPATLFGGSWTQLEDRFLLGAGSTYTAGTTGGEATHTLTIDEMPRHSHKLLERYSGGSTEWRLESGQNKSRWHDEFCGATGGDQPHNNMPPYLVVYMWERTA